MLVDDRDRLEFGTSTTWNLAILAWMIVGIVFVVGIIGAGVVTAAGGQLGRVVAGIPATVMILLPTLYLGRHFRSRYVFDDERGQIVKTSWYGLIKKRVALDDVEEIQVGGMYFIESTPDGNSGRMTLDEVLSIRFVSRDGEPLLEIRGPGIEFKSAALYLLVAARAAEVVRVPVRLMGFETRASKPLERLWDALAALGSPMGAGLQRVARSGPNPSALLHEDDGSLTRAALLGGVGGVVGTGVGKAIRNEQRQRLSDSPRAVGTFGDPDDAWDLDRWRDKYPPVPPSTGPIHPISVLVILVVNVIAAAARGLFSLSVTLAFGALGFCFLASVALMYGAFMLLIGRYGWLKADPMSPGRLLFFNRWPGLYPVTGVLLIGFSLIGYGAVPFLQSPEVRERQAAVANSWAVDNGLALAGRPEPENQIKGLDELIGQSRRGTPVRQSPQRAAVLRRAEELLKSPNREIRVRAVEVVGRWNDPADAVRTLEPFLTDRDRTIQDRALDVIREIYQDEIKAELGPDMIRERVPRLAYRVVPAPNGKREAIYQERNMRGYDVGLELITKPEPEAREKGVELLARDTERKHPRRADVLRLVEPFLNNPNRDVRQNAFDALSHWGTQETIAVLQPYLQDPDRDVRDRAKRAIEEIQNREKR
ncbi:hypothetical protein FRUB_09083 [Fimbriiglobus ruber]|uniref:HEAT repeat domain-containing protein n=1 Tax=Fimbriiglobus ruber TaxID=1908690 RepID=A0A225D4L6_9BACT|nr:hypothetical protein FRUB_09083 [Fimbriiglobus ruber]